MNSNIDCWRAQGYYISLISHLVIDHWMCFFRISLKMGEAQRIGEFTQQTVAEIELPLWVMVLTIQQWILLKQANWLFCKQLNRDGVKGDICSNDRLLGKQICVQLHVGTKSRCLFSGMCIYHVYWYLNMQTEHYCIDYAFSPFQQWRVLSALFCFINFRQIPIAATSFCNLVFRDNSVPFLTFVLQ